MATKQPIDLNRIRRQNDMTTAIPQEQVTEQVAPVEQPTEQVIPEVPQEQRTAPTPEESVAWTPVKQKQAVTPTEQAVSEPIDVQASQVENVQEAVPVPKTQVVDSNFLMTQTASTVADMVVNNTITPQDIQQLSQTDPLKYQEVNALVSKRRVENEINQERTEYKDALVQYEADVSRIRSEWWEEAVARYRQATDTPEINAYASEMNKLSAEITEIDDQLEYMLDDFIDNNPSGDPRAILWLASEARKELIRERNTKVASLSLAQSNYNRLYQQAQKEYEIFTASEQQKQAQELTLASERLWIDREMLALDLQSLESQMVEIDNILWGIASTRQLQQEFEQELMLKQIDQGFELETMDIKFQQDMARDNVQFQRDVWKMWEQFNYDSILKNMDIESRFALAQYWTQEKLNIMQAQHALDQEKKNYEMKFLDDGSVIAVNKNDPTDYRMINKDGWKPYLDSIGSWKITSRGWKHDNFQWIDIDWVIGDPIPWVKGTVVNVVTWKWQTDFPSYGNYVDIQDENWYVHRYAHLNDVMVEPWQKVSTTQMIGTMWNSGYTIAWAWGDWSHLDYSVKKPDGTWFNSREIPWYLATIQDPTSPEWKPLSFRNESESKSFMFADRMFSSNQILNTLEDENMIEPWSNRLWRYWDIVTNKVAPNLLEAQWYQSYDQAKRDFINSVLRKESWAVISDQEFENAEKQYFVQAWDSKQTILQKRDNRNKALNWLIQTSGATAMNYFEWLQESIKDVPEAPKEFNPDEIMMQYYSWGSVLDFY